MKRLLITAWLAVFACSSAACATAGLCAAEDPLARLALNDPELAKARARKIAEDLEAAAKALRAGKLPDGETHESLEYAGKAAQRLSRCLQ